MKDHIAEPSDKMTSIRSSHPDTEKSQKIRAKISHIAMSRTAAKQPKKNAACRVSSLLATWFMLQVCSPAMGSAIPKIKRNT